MLTNASKPSCSRNTSFASGISVMIRSISSRCYNGVRDHEVSGRSTAMAGVGDVPAAVHPNPLHPLP